jgi:hypothetical protein
LEGIEYYQEVKLDPEREEKPKQGLGNKLWYIIGGVVVVGLIAFFAISHANSSSSTPRITLQGVNTQVQTNTADIASLRVAEALQAVNITAIQTTVHNLQQSIGSVPDWTANITTLNDKWADIQNQVAILGNLTANLTNTVPYVLITGLNESDVDATVYGEGNFSVVLTLYGTGMGNAMIFNWYPATYTYALLSLGSDNTTMVFLAPFDNWANGDIIKLTVNNCTVEHASACLGR